MNLSAIILAISHLVRLASTYGSHAYSSCNFDGTNCGGGGILPGTGGLIWPLIFGGIIIIGLAFFFWLWRRRRKRSLRQPPTNLPN